MFRVQKMLLYTGGGSGDQSPGPGPPCKGGGPPDTTRQMVGSWPISPWPRNPACGPDCIYCESLQQRISVSVQFNVTVRASFRTGIRNSVNDSLSASGSVWRQSSSWQKYQYRCYSWPWNWLWCDTNLQRLRLSDENDVHSGTDADSDSKAKKWRWYRWSRSQSPTSARACQLWGNSCVPISLNGLRLHYWKRIKMWHCRVQWWRPWIQVGSESRSRGGTGL